MRMVRNRADARLLPSRHHFAMFRLIAYLRLLSSKPQPADMILTIDRNQSNVETALVAIWYVVTLTCFTAAWLFPSWPIALAIVPAFFIALFGLELPIYAGGLSASAWNAATRTPVDAVRVNSILMMAILAAAAAHFTRSATWIRFVGLQVFALLALNAIAAVIVFLLRGSIARLEASRFAS